MFAAITNQVANQVERNRSHADNAYVIACVHMISLCAEALKALDEGIVRQCHY